MSGESPVIHTCGTPVRSERYASVLPSGENSGEYADFIERYRFRMYATSSGLGSGSKAVGCAPGRLKLDGRGSDYAAREAVATTAKTASPTARRSDPGRFSRAPGGNNSI